MAEEEGLSQEDFRKLLQTPRPGTTTTPKFKAPPPKTPRNSGAVFAKPASVRNKKKKNGEDDSKNKTTTQSNYRDRAAERRIEEQGSETTEDLLRPMEEDESLNAQQIYEQSKYLGGDLQHTHLVKGLDYTLLNKVRRQLQEKKKVNMDDDEEDNNDQPMAATDEQIEDELEDVLDRLDKGETFTDTKDDVVGDISKLSITAKTLHDLLIPSSSSSDKAVKVHELFKPGRMAFVFPLATVKGGYQVGKHKQPKLEYTGDPFAMPTAVIRSKADLSDKQLQQQQKQNKHSSGWSDDALQESNLIISKIAQVMQRSQSTSTTNINETNTTTTTTVSNIKSSASATKSAPSNNAKDDDDNSDDEIFLFGDVGTDYTLDESIIEKNKKKDQQETSSISKTNYFMDEEEDGSNQNETMEHEVETPSKFSDIKSTSTTTQYGNMIENDRMDKKRKYNHLMDPTLEEGIDADSQDMDMFGLSTSALPTSFEDRQRMYVLDDDDDDDENGKRPDGRKKSGGDDDDDDKPTTTLLIDQGTHKNKKAQLSRWDFDDEEQWQHYKSTIEIQPKSAAQFGVKMGDGRKRNKERRLMSDKQKLNREYQQVKNIMDKKYGKN